MAPRVPRRQTDSQQRQTRASSQVPTTKQKYIAYLEAEARKRKTKKYTKRRLPYVAKEEDEGKDKDKGVDTGVGGSVSKEGALFVSSGLSSVIDNTKELGKGSIKRPNKDEVLLNVSLGTLS